MRVALKIVALVISVVLLMWGGVELAWIHREAAVVTAELRRDHRILGRAVAVPLARLDDGDLATARALVAEISSSEREIAMSLRPGAPPAGASQGTVPGDRLVTELSVSVGTTPATLVLAEPLTEVARVEAAGRQALLLRGGGMFLMAVLLAAFGGRSLVGRRLDALVARTRTLARGELAPQPVSPARDEIGELAVAIEDLAGDLGRAQARAHEEQERRIDALERLRHADRLRLVGDLAAGIAHELGSPLHVVGGAARLLAEDPTLDAEARELAEDVRDQARRMDRLVQSLLERAHPGHAPLHPLPTATLMDAARPVLAGLSRGTGVTVAVVHHDEATVQFRVGWWQQVVANLVRNAVQAQVPGGGRVELALRRADGRLCLTVDDAGPGLSAEVQARLFQPFVTTKAAGDGLGLGLSIVRGLVEEAGGEISAGSAALGGARFSVYLPLAEEAACPDES